MTTHPSHPMTCRTPLAPHVLFSETVFSHGKERAGRRKQQSREARTLAGELQTKLLGTDDPIERGEKGEPVWPEGMTGSISHCALNSSHSLVAVVVGESVRENLVLGLDIEPCSSSERLERLTGHIFSDKERAVLADSQFADALTIGFSAKESIYKALFPLCRQWFSFQKAEIKALSEDRITVRLDSTLASTCAVPQELDLLWSRDQVFTTSVAGEKESCSVIKTLLALQRGTTYRTSTPSVDWALAA